MKRTLTGVTAINSTWLSLVLLTTSLLAGCSYTFDKIRADVPQIDVKSPYPLRAGFRVVDAGAPMKLGDDGPCIGDWPKPFPYGQVLKETATGALSQLFEEFEEIKPNMTYDLVIEMKLDEVSHKSPCSANKANYYEAIGSMLTLSQQGRRLWASTKNHGRQVEADADYESSRSMIAKSIGKAINLLVKGWVAELQQSGVLDRLVAKARRTRDASEAQTPTGTAAAPATPSLPGSVAITPSQAYRLPPPPEDGLDPPRESGPSMHARTADAATADLPPVAKTDSFMLIQRRGFFVLLGGGLSSVYVGRIANSQANYPGFQGTSWDFNGALGGALATGLVLALEWNIDLLGQSKDVQIASGGNGRPLFVTLTGGLTWFPTKRLGLSLGAYFGAAIFAVDSNSSGGKDSSNSPGYQSAVPWGEIQIGYDLNLTGEISVGLQLHAGTGLDSGPADKKLTVATSGLRLVLTAF
jgi:hypothetical protein